MAIGEQDSHGHGLEKRHRIASPDLQGVGLPLALVPRLGPLQRQAKRLGELLDEFLPLPLGGRRRPAHQSDHAGRLSVNENGRGDRRLDPGVPRHIGEVGFQILGGQADQPFAGHDLRGERAAEGELAQLGRDGKIRLRGQQAEKFALPLPHANRRRRHAAPELRREFREQPIPVGRAAGNTSDATQQLTLLTHLQLAPAGSLDRCHQLECAGTERKHHPASQHGAPRGGQDREVLAQEFEQCEASEQHPQPMLGSTGADLPRMAPNQRGAGPQQDGAQRGADPLSHPRFDEMQETEHRGSEPKPTTAP